MVPRISKSMFIPRERGEVLCANESTFKNRGSPNSAKMSTLYVANPFLGRLSSLAATWARSEGGARSPCRSATAAASGPRGPRAAKTPRLSPPSARSARSARSGRPCRSGCQDLLERTGADEISATWVRLCSISGFQKGEKKTIPRQKFPNAFFPSHALRHPE